MLERVRREEAELLKSKLQTIREQEDRLQVDHPRILARARGPDSTSDQIPTSRVVPSGCHVIADLMRVQCRRERAKGHQ